MAGGSITVIGKVHTAASSTAINGITIMTAITAAITIAMTMVMAMIKMITITTTKIAHH
jgi:hypothetical protein